MNSQAFTGSTVQKKQAIKIHFRYCTPIKTKRRNKKFNGLGNHRKNEEEEEEKGKRGALS